MPFDSCRPVEVTFCKVPKLIETEPPKTDPCARLKIQLTELREFYVPGDKLSGKLVLIISDASYSLQSVSVALICSESVSSSIEGSYSQTYLRLEPIENFTALLERCNSDGCGQFESEFSIDFDSGVTSSSPPTFSLEENPLSGVVWALRAEARIASGEFKAGTRDIEDVVPIEFYPTNNNAIQTSDLSRSLCCGKPDITISCPYLLPQWPAATFLDLRYGPDKSKSEKTALQIYFEKKILLVRGDKVEVVTERSFLGSLNDVDANKDSIIPVRCQLQKREPSAFVSDIITAKYQICVEINPRYSSRFAFRFPIDIVPPHRRSGWVSEALESLCTASPPAYAE